MMLPGVGTDVKEMMKSKIEEVITQQVSSRLRDYEAIRCVIRAAVDDAGQLLLSDMDSDVDEGDIDGDMPFRNSNRRMMGIQDLDDIEGEDDNEFTDSYRTTDIDESQIPAVVEVAMDAVLSYMSEIIIPALIIHDTTGAIQSVHQIGQHKAPHHTNIDYNGSGDVDFDVSQSLSNGIESVGDNDDEEGDPNRRTLDEDLWGQVIESKDWDSSGHLFEDFEEEAERYRDENSDQELTSGNKVEHEENEDDKNPYVVGIQEDVDEEDEALGSNFAPDSALEPMLTQLIEPLLTVFIEEDFPASCRRAQGELMDDILWLLDQTELNHSNTFNDEDHLALLSELEY
ncbi:hypothetical protein BGX34_007101 [Mortierella sp. NVP85]|nr:hypothetical protein BGX34_007101 [Mortierella sp. NVP85]